MTDVKWPEWQSAATLPCKDENERFHVYLAFDDGLVKLADWVSYTELGSEFHGTTGEYLGQFPQGGDAYYMTDDGYEVRLCDDGGFWFYYTYPDGLDKPQLGARVTAWMEALRPLPPAPRGQIEERSDEVAAGKENSQPDTQEAIARTRP